MDRGLWTSALVGFLASLALFSPFDSAEAGFLDWLFGTRKPVAAAPPHPQVTVSKRAKSVKGPRVKVARAPLAKPIDPKEQLARTIDPSKRPDWYLIDPTLKKGDVLFLKNRVVVFKGRKAGELSDYVPVANSRLLSKSERRLIEALAPSAGPAPEFVASPRRRGRTVASAAAAGPRANGSSERLTLLREVRVAAPLS